MHFPKLNFMVSISLEIQPPKMYKPLKILCLEERKLEVFMGSKDTYPKGSGMNMMTINPVGIYWIRSEGRAYRDQTGGKNPVRLDTFLVKAVSKAPPSATHINPQNALTESYHVFYVHAIITMKAIGTSFHLLSWSIRYPMIFLGLCLERVQWAMHWTGAEY